MLYNKYVLLLCLKVTLWSKVSSLLHHSQDKGAKKEKQPHIDGIDWIAWSKKIHILLNLSF